MTAESAPPANPILLLGIEAGGTRTVALLAEAHGKPLRRIEAGPANLRLLSDSGLFAILDEIARQTPTPAAIGIGMAGLRTKDDQRRLQAAVTKVWANIPCWLGNDLETALAAAGSAPQGIPQVLVLSGTGSCCFGRRADGRTVKVGGWGHILGDAGSGYDIAVRALRAVVAAFDQSGNWPPLGKRLLRALMLNTPNDLLAWVHGAPKDEVAQLTPEVFAAWKRGDRLANSVVREAAHELANDALACARRLAPPSSSVRFVLAGGVLLGERKFASLFRQDLKQARLNSRVECLPREGAWGAIQLAKAALASGNHARTGGAKSARAAAIRGQPNLPIATDLSPTEERNPRSMRLDQLPLRAAIRLMINEDRRITSALLREERGLGRAVRFIVRALQKGGRLFYVGAGTSGRLGVLDASECPPTFRTRPEMVQGIIAGGANALWQSVEGAEDDFAAGAEALRCRGLTRQDIVVGLAASGRTPFVWGALQAARQHHARTVFVCFNPNLRFPRAIRPDIVIAPRIGPELLTGSTRLKAGTATKIILNLFTTLAMVKLGKVVSNLMVDLNPSNTKLRDRAVRIVQQLTGADEQDAREALENAGWVIKDALAQSAKMADSHPARSRNIRARRRAGAA